MAFRFVLFVLPTLALANIYVEILGQFKGDAKDLKVYYSGQDISKISDAERTIFKVDDNNLKNAIRACYGRRPDDVYVRSPTPWGDLYSRYGWNEISRTLVPISGKILRVASQPILVVNQTFENNSTKPTKYNAGLTQTVLNTVSTSWSTGKDIFLRQKLFYGVNILYHLIGEISFSYTSSWGKNTQMSQTVTVGASSHMDITLQPGESAVARLEATREFIQVEIEYEASLSGLVACNYADKYNDGHFWGVDIDICMNIFGLGNQKRSREVIDIGFYSDSKVVVSDKQRGDILMDVSF